MPEVLDIEWVVTDESEWPYAELLVTPHLTVTHGWLARKGAGASARATVERLRRSVIVGHTHRLAQVYVTYDEETPLIAVEGGTMALIRGGLGYAMKPDWQNGFTIIHVHPEGKFHIVLAPIIDGSVYY